MQLTDAQTATKKAVATHLLTMKENSYQNMLSMQDADMAEAEDTNENEQNMFEDARSTSR